MFTVSLSRVLLLFVIHHSTMDPVDGQNIDSNTLARIITFFEQNYKRNEHQYAVAINVPVHQCQPGFQPSQNSFLTNEDAEIVRMKIANAQDPVYEGTELIAAGVQKMVRYSLHSEYLLLIEGRQNNFTPMQNLLNSRRDSCTILYTLNSPCTDICLNENSNRNIFPGLQNWSTHSSIKALVFKHVWDNDLNRFKRALSEIMRYVPLYRCTNDNECYNCNGPYGEIYFNCYIDS